MNYLFYVICIVVSIVGFVFSCGKIPDVVGQSIIKTEIGKEWQVPEDVLNGDSPSLVCSALRNKRFSFKQRSSNEFRFNIKSEQCDGVKIDKFVRASIEFVGGTKMEFRSSEPAFNKNVESDVNGVFAVICSKILSGTSVKSVIDSGDGRKVYYSFGAIKANRSPIEVEVVTAIKDSEKKDIVYQKEMFSINILEKTSGDSDQGLVESRSLQLKCTNSKMFNSSQVVVH